MKFYCILLLLTGFSCYVFGAENSKEVTSDFEKVRPKSSDSIELKSTNINPIKKRASPVMKNTEMVVQKFNPSEEISEDLAIPFPVDI